jgi:uncharacterized protein
MFDAARFLDITTKAPRNGRLLQELRSFDLPQCHVVAGCLFQAVWNHQSGRPLEDGIKDWDVFYFDDADTSYEAEDRVIQALANTFGPYVEVRNQARVHLWYGPKYGVERAPLKSCEDGIASFLVECSCVGINVATGGLVAPYGLDDLWAGKLVRNEASGTPDLFAAKAASYQARWPHLTIIEQET